MAKFTLNYYFGNGNSVHETIEASNLDSAQEALQKRLGPPAAPMFGEAPRDFFHVDVGSQRYVIPRASLQYCLIVCHGETGAAQSNYLFDEADDASGEKRCE